MKTRKPRTRTKGSGVRKGLRNTRAVLLMVSFVVVLALLVVNLMFVNIYSEQDQAYARMSADLRVLSQEIAKNSNAAFAGSDEAFAGLSRSRMDFDDTWRLLNQGADSYIDTGLGFSTPLPGKNMDINTQEPGMEGLWTRVRVNADLILGNQDRIQELNAIAAEVRETIPQLQRNYEEVVNLLLDNDAPLAIIAVAQRQAWLSERIALNLNRLITGDEQAQAGLQQFQRDISLFSNNHGALLEGDMAMGVEQVTDENIRGRLEEISTLFVVVEGQSDGIISAAPDIIEASAAVDSIASDSDRLLTAATSLSEYFISQRGNHIASPLVGYALLSIILVVIILYGLEVIRQSRQAEKLTGQINQRNNNAVMNLLEEISDLADGDLTVQATVSEEFTGAIADSINYAIAQLRELVTAITGVSGQVTDATRSSAETAKYLSDASARQTRSITSVSESVREMELSINRVSDNAMRSLDVARNSVDIASGGAEVVKNTIQGMDSIRDQIQETSKRIKRLGESSQEIGGFVSLINNISDHTNTLSLNAAIQAAMAGESGKGFGVVADEVHALAERSTDATRQIESLVKVIQRDINEAVLSMEQTTTEVVEGTHLAQNAGEALDDIEKVSKELAALVEEIAEAARNQSQTASEITSSMEVIQQITTETSEGTRATSEFIENLAKLTERLQSAVSGFSLSRAEEQNNVYEHEGYDAEQEGDVDDSIATLQPEEDEYKEDDKYNVPTAISA